MKARFSNVNIYLSVLLFCLTTWWGVSFITEVNKICEWTLVYVTPLHVFNHRKLHNCVWTQFVKSLYVPSTFLSEILTLLSFLLLTKSFLYLRLPMLLTIFILVYLADFQFLYYKRRIFRGSSAMKWIVPQILHIAEYVFNIFYKN